MYKIEKGVPINRTHSKYNFHKMEVGDCLNIPIGRYNNNKAFGLISRVGLASSDYAKKEGFGFTTRRQPDGSYRIWRTK